MITILYKYIISIAIMLFILFATKLCIKDNTNKVITKNVQKIEKMQDVILKKSNTEGQEELQKAKEKHNKPAENIDKDIEDLNEIFGN